MDDSQKEKYIYSPIKNGTSLTRDDIKDLSLRDIMSAVFVLANLKESNLNDKSKKTKDDNRGFLLSMAADWLKNNTFYMICSKDTNSPMTFVSGGIRHTLVFSTIELANKVINGDADLYCKEISSQKAKLWQSLLQKGIAQVIVDCSPMPLTVQGCYIYSLAKTD